MRMSHALRQSQRHSNQLAICRIYWQSYAQVLAKVAKWAQEMGLKKWVETVDEFHMNSGCRLTSE
jgi:hypothetical protein